MAYQNDADYIRENVSELDRLDQLMEECSELLVACSKRKRALKGTNPTPVTAEEALQEIKHESQDVLNVMQALGLVDMGTAGATDRMQWKMKRWVGRIMTDTETNSQSACAAGSSQGGES